MYGQTDNFSISNKSGASISITAMDATGEPVITTQMHRMDEAIKNLDERIQELIKHISPVMLPIEPPNIRIPGGRGSPECALACTLGDFSARVEALARLLYDTNCSVQL